MPTDSISAPTLRRTFRLTVAALIGLVWAALWAQPTLADRSARIAATGGVALGGYDPVAYFTAGTALAGDPTIALRWRGLRWHFSSPAHRTAFEANPKAYLPQFGGHCPVSLADGQPRPADPHQWAIVEGRLYIAAEAAALNRFLAQNEALRRRAQAQWSGMSRLAVGD